MKKILLAALIFLVCAIPVKADSLEDMAECLDDLGIYSVEDLEEIADFYDRYSEYSYELGNLSENELNNFETIIDMGEYAFFEDIESHEHLKEVIDFYYSFYEHKSTMEDISDSEWSNMDEILTFYDEYYPDGYYTQSTTQITPGHKSRFDLNETIWTILIILAAIVCIYIRIRG